MKKIDWIIALFFIIMGLCCLTASAASWFRTDIIQSYTSTLVKICLLGTLPVVLALLIYFIKQRFKKH